MQTTPTPRPIIKWAGGKQSLLAELARRAPPTFGRYFEPFAGGAAMFFHLAPQDAVLSDTNADLVNLYQVLATDVEAVIRRLYRHRARHGKRHYYQIRERWNDRSYRWSPAARAAAFVYLNRTCFNGLYRVNRDGKFNVPIGRQVDPKICSPIELRAAGTALAGASIRCSSYQAAVASATAGDFVYFDPPYDPISATASFTAYQAGGFSRDDQRQLADLARELVRRGCHVMLSNHDTRFVRSLYKGFRISRVLCRRSISAKVAKRAPVAELVITGGSR